MDSESQKPSKSNKKLVIISVTTALAVLVIALVGIAILSSQLAKDANSVSGNETAVKTLDVSNADQALIELNKAASEGVLSLAGGDFNSVLTDPDKALAIPGTDKSLDAAKIQATTLSVTNGTTELELTLDAIIGRQNGKIVMQGNMVLSGNIGIGDIKAEYDIMLIDAVMYLKANSLTSSSPLIEQGLASYRENIIGKWYKADSEDYLKAGIPGLTGESETSANLSALDGIEAFNSAENIENKTINGQEFECINAEYNPEAIDILFGSLSTGMEISDLTFCTAEGGYTPIYTEITLLQEDTETKTSYILTPSNEQLTVEVPEGTLDISEIGI